MTYLTDKHKIPFLIDDEDLLVVSQHKWHIRKGYVLTTINHTDYALHRIILGDAPEGKVWDHWNRNKLDNRRENLRLVTRTTNERNKDLRRSNKSGVTGVYHYKRKKTSYWRAAIDHKILGYFKTKDEAIQARLTAEKELWGENEVWKNPNSELVSSD